MAKSRSEKIRETLAEKYGSYEDYLELTRQWGKKGGKNNVKKGFGSDKIGSDGLTGSERAKKSGSKGGRHARN